MRVLEGELVLSFADDENEIVTLEASEAVRVTEEKGRVHCLRNPNLTKRAVSIHVYTPAYFSLLDLFSFLFS